MICKFKQVDENNPQIKICEVCKRKVVTPYPVDKIIFSCKGEPKPISLKLKLQAKEALNIQNELKEKRMPSIGTQIKNAFWAGIDFIKNPELVEDKSYLERLQICHECPERVDNRCSKCGCNLNIKAKGAAFNCPLKKWPGDK